MNFRCIGEDHLVNWEKIHFHLLRDQDVQWTRFLRVWFYTKCDVGKEISQCWFWEDMSTGKREKSARDQQVLVVSTEQKPWGS